MKKLNSMMDSMSHSQVRNYATAGLTSKLIGGGGYGLVRLFDASRDTAEIVPHSHKFDFACLVLFGTVDNIVYSACDPAEIGANEYSLGYMSGGLGKYQTRYSNPGHFKRRTEKYQAGDEYYMVAHQIHTIRFSKGARVLFFEGPETENESMFLEPYVDGKTIPTFKTEDWMFER